MTTGRCLCGAVRYEFTGVPRLITHCHCDSCRRQTSSPMTTFLIVSKAAVHFTHGQPKEFVSSPGVRRSFCDECGSPIYYLVDDRPDDIDLYACTLDHPTTLTPSCHVHSLEQLPWLEVLDDLPRYPGSSQGAPPIRRGPRR